MTNRNTISNELMGLGSTLANFSPQNFYEVPDGYFEGLANQILNRIKALEVSNAKEELEILSPLLNRISREIPYALPVGYFDGLEEKLMQAIREHADYHTSEEELALLSPLLSGISKKSPYAVPAGYFKNLGSEVTAKSEVKVISITSRKWYRYAAAAVIVGIIAIGGLLFINQKQIDPNKNPQAWVKKNVKKEVSQKQLDEFVTLADEDADMKIPEGNNTVKSDEIKELMKDVSEKEIQEFLNETVAVESIDAADVFLNQGE